MRLSVWRSASSQVEPTVLGPSSLSDWKYRLATPKKNHPSNLALMTREEHTRWHILMRGHIRVRLVCPWCQQKFTRRKNKTHLVSGGRITSCSRSCGNTFAWRYRRNPTDPELLRRMENNVEEEYDSRTEAQPPTPITELQTSALSPEELTELLDYQRIYRSNRRRHNKKPELRKCIGCGTKFEVKHKTATYCSNKCRGKSNRKTKRPSKEKLQRLVWKYPTTKIAERLGVSDSAVGKWCRQYGIDKPPRGYWAKQRLRK